MLEALESRVLLSAASAAALRAENAKPGSPDWSLPANPAYAVRNRDNPAQVYLYNGAVDGSMTNPARIQGFATKTSVLPGQRIEFKVDSGSASYQLDIYRLGWYQGAGARLWATLVPDRPPPGGRQPRPLVDQATHLVDASDWAVTVHRDVPVSAVAGVYLAKLVRTDPGYRGSASFIQFVVRGNEQDHSDVIFQTADTTQQAYNGWGREWLAVNHRLRGDAFPGDAANGLYHGELPPAMRGSMVSYDRPYDERLFVLGQELQTIQWLERSGYDVSYTTGADVARNPSSLLGHRAFIVTGHDEYWSGEQYAAMRQARDAGVSLMLLSGNEGYWKTRWLPDAQGSPFRTMVCYKESNRHTSGQDPAVWTGTWRDPAGRRGGAVPEYALIGSMYVALPKDPATAAALRATPLRVPYGYHAEWFWRDSNIARLAPNTSATLSGVTLGDEWDTDPTAADISLPPGDGAGSALLRDTLNGLAPFRPAGLTYLSDTAVSVPDGVIVDPAGVGTGRDGIVTQHMTLYRAASGAWVFASGTGNWAEGLAWTGSGDLNPDVGRATSNFLEAAGAGAAHSYR